MKKNRFLALALALLVAFSQVSVLAEDKTTHEIAPTVLSETSHDANKNNTSNIDLDPAVGTPQPQKVEISTEVDAMQNVTTLSTESVKPQQAAPRTQRGPKDWSNAILPGTAPMLTLLHTKKDNVIDNNGDITYRDSQEITDFDQPLNIENGDVLSFKINWKIDETIANSDDPVLPQDYLEFDLPKHFASTANLFITEYGTYKVEDGKVRFTFNEALNSGSTSSGLPEGKLNLNLRADLNNVDLNVPFDITIPYTDEKVLTLNPRLDVKDDVTKKVLSAEANGQTITWEIDINRSSTSITNAKLLETLPEHSSLVSVTKTELKPILKNGNLSLEPVSNTTTPLDVASQTGSNVEISLGDIDKPYRIHVTTKTDDSSIDQSKEFETLINHAKLTGEGIKPGSKTEDSASFTYTLPEKVTKEHIAGVENSGKDSWAVAINPHKVSLKTGTVFKDTLSGIASTYDSSSFKFKVGSKTYTLADLKQDSTNPNKYTFEGSDATSRFSFELNNSSKNPHFELTYLSNSSERVDITYDTIVTLPEKGNSDNVTTQPDGNVTNRIIGKTGDTVIGSGGGTGAGYHGRIISKSRPVIDYATETMTWTVEINNKEYLHDKIFVSDMLQGTHNIFSIDTDSLKLDGVAVSTTTHSSLTFTKIGDNVTGFSFEINPPKPTKQRYVLTYTTKFDARQFETSEAIGIANNAAVELSNGSTTLIDTTRVSESIRTTVSHNGEKRGHFDFNDPKKIIKWENYLNFNNRPVKDAIVFTDVLQDNQVYHRESLKFFRYTVDANGRTVLGDDISNDLSITPTVDIAKTINDDQTESQTTTLTIRIDGDNLKALGSDQRIAIIFETDIKDVEAPQEVINTAQVTYDDYKTDITAKVKVSDGQHVVKSSPGAIDIDASGNVKIPWQIDINQRRSKLQETIQVQDLLNDTHLYLPETLKVYKVVYDSTGQEIPEKAELLEPNQYSVTYLNYANDGKTVLDGPINEPHRQGFKLKTPVTKGNEYASFKVTYQTESIVSEGRVEWTNNVSMAGIITDSGTKTVTDSSQNSYTYGSGSSGVVNLELEILKISESNITDKYGKPLNGGDPLENIQFKLITPNGRTIREATTDRDGKLAFKGLYPGKYRIEEVAPYPGYVSIAPRDIVLSANTEADRKKHETVVNYPLSIEVLKASVDGTALAGATFELYTHSESDGYTLFRSAQTSDAQGRIVFTNDINPASGVTADRSNLLEDGVTYYLKETQAPDGFIHNDAYIPVTVSVNNNGLTTVNVVNHKAKLSFAKTDALGNTLSGATFGLFTDASATQQVYEATSNTQGLVSFENVAVGNYYLKETQAAPGYVLDNTITPVVVDLHSPLQVELDSRINYQGSVTLTKHNANSDVLEGAVYKLYDASNNQIGDTYTTDINGLISVTDLAPGSYSFVEVVAPNGYLLNTIPVTFTIAASASGEPTPVVTNHINYKGSVSLIKEAPTGQTLEGAVYKLYDAAMTQIGDTYTTDVNGLISVENLAPGSYSFVEIAAPNGYLVNTTPAVFTIMAQAEGNLTNTVVKHVNYQGSVSFTKENVNGDVLEGAVYKLYDSSNNQIGDTYTTDINGLIFVENLAPGAYSFVEVTAPLGYLINTVPATFTIASEAIDTPIAITAHHINYKGSVTLTKGNKDGNVLAGAVYKLYDADNNQIGDTYTTDINGLISVDNLAPGTYSFVEITAPQGYLLNTVPATFTIASEAVENQTATAVTHINYKGTVSLIKESPNGTVLEGAVYKLYDAQNQQIGDTYTTDVNGIISVADLAPGSYSFIEVQAPHGYLINTTPVSFTVVDEAVDNLTNTIARHVNYQGSVSLTKQDANGDLLEGASYQLYDETMNQIGDTYTTDINGLISVENLAPGTYSFVEISAPQGYVINTTPITFVIDAEAMGAPTRVETSHINYKGSVSFVKQDASGHVLEGATYKLYDATMKQIGDTYVTDESGLITVSDLAPGTYQFVEVAAPNGYIINTVPAEFTIQAESKGEPASVVIHHINYKGSVSLIKEDAHGNRLQDAVYKLYDADKQQIGDTYTTDTQGTIVVSDLAPGTYTFVEVTAPNGFMINTLPATFTIKSELAGEPSLVVAHHINYQGSLTVTKVDPKGNIIGEATFELLDASLNPVATLTTVNGIAHFEDLAPGTYSLRETVAPQGYVLSKEIITIEIPETYAGAFESIAVEFENDEEPIVLGESKEPKKPSETLPQTGVSNSVLLSGTALTLMGLCALIIAKRRKHTKN
ncbi:SpaA isopeptide-forming pilin-related protein [Erysipelothrix anatis]|uniref:SpaA isopeptide-forming pilin-related protein n=1 Tax=Erysipelothrix anatis TaxID=2683713 RepID=UPI001357B0BD|nr:SpaA isopeptide-forming pilin-related protein [Erysipelothrix anatis]